MCTKGANLILDNGGDATLYRLLGACIEAREEVLAVPTSEEEASKQGSDQETYRRNARLVCEDEGRYHQRVQSRYTHGPSPSLRAAQNVQMPFPAINVNDSVTKSEFGNKYGCEESLVDGR